MTLAGSEFEAVDDVRVLRLRPGDAIVITVKSPLSDDENKRLIRHLQGQFPGTQVMILYGAKLEVLRAEEVAGE